MQNLEAVYVEATIKPKRVLIGKSYSNTEYFNSMNENIDRAYNTNIIDTLMTMTLILILIQTKPVR